MRTGTLLGVIDLVGRPESVQLARQFASIRLGEGHPALEDVILLTSEVVTNAITHSNSRDGGRVTVVMVDCHEYIHVNVSDAGAKTAPRLRTDTNGENGRGLVLVDALSRDWGVREDAGRRTVFFEVAYDFRQAPAHLKQSAMRRTAEQAARTVTESAAVGWKDPDDDTPTAGCHAAEAERWGE
ncbi:hypothetical protein Sme01_60980 [Sphaerisporangium melleum]|uniref:Histidine kinase/HSP90-like ATPase domain-containing protein n=1 Tax=Sphaerisporangium melleum TaxID=321316 RepID=A0A917RBB5_9ACTN|nr:ATP-binding protein [Sphaerisporangium melleum]GGK99654.1 hypothetical protein GCM10007964_47180 [Sphaerisporangium melleum]GII73622.1 hypothetical protein Sme01_60980 [Sphaerisporangium melleum]